MVALVVVESQQSFAKHYGEEVGYKGEERQHHGVEMCSRVRLPSLYLSLYIYRGKGERWDPLGDPI